MWINPSLSEVVGMNQYATQLFPTTGVSQVDNGEYYWYSAQPLEVSALLRIYQSLDKGRT